MDSISVDDLQKVMESYDVQTLLKLIRDANSKEEEAEPAKKEAEAIAQEQPKKHWKEELGYKVDLTGCAPISREEIMNLGNRTIVDKCVPCIKNKGTHHTVDSPFCDCLKRKRTEPRIKISYKRDEFGRLVC